MENNPWDKIHHISTTALWPTHTCPEVTPRIRHPCYFAPMPGQKGTQHPSAPADPLERSIASARASYLAAMGLRWQGDSHGRSRTLQT